MNRNIKATFLMMQAINIDTQTKGLSLTLFWVNKNTEGEGQGENIF